MLQESGWDNVYLLSVKGGKPRPVTQGEQEDHDLVFSPDGKSLAIVSNRELPEASRIWIVNLNSSGTHPLTHFDKPALNPRLNGLRTVLLFSFIAAAL